MSRALTDHLATSFREDAPRPPVPGEEGDATPRCRPPGKLTTMRPLDTAKSILLLKPPGFSSTTTSSSSSSSTSTASSSSATRRRNEDGLGEPEGSASPDSPLSRWTKSLHSLLGDQDGALLFRTFLEREKCVDTLDFWFACNGFRQMDPRDGKTQRVVKAIYKRYVENGGVVAAQLKPATKTFIRDNLKRVDSAMFDQAQTEIQGTMEETSYRTFLASDVYLEYVRSGGESHVHGHVHVHPGGLGDLKAVCGYLPTLNEEEEWSCDFRAKALVGLSAKALRATMSARAVEVMDKAYGTRMYRRPEAVNPYHVGSRAPAASTNDSEVSSDAMTDDAMSVTDSLDGVPPYKTGSKKHLHREVERNLRMNSQVSLPAFPCARPPPKEMVPVKPLEFATQLISRLERLKREQDTRSSLEERLQQIQEEEERDDAAETPNSAPHPLVLLAGPSEDDPQAILDEHLSRVLKTPGCQSPAVLRHSPRSRSPERRGASALHGASVLRALLSPPGASGAPPAPGPGQALASRQSTKHIHHHYIHHHHAGPRSQEQMEREAARRVQGLCARAGEGGPPYQRSRSLGREMCGSAAVELNNPGRSSSLSRHQCRSGAEEGVPEGCPEESAPLVHLPTDTSDRSQNVWQWMLESERQGKHRSHSAQITKKSFGGGPAHTWGGGSALLRTHQPAHPFIQDPAMPPLPPPNTLAQLEEACRRLEEVSTKPSKQRHSTSSPQKSHLVPVQNGVGVALSSANPNAAILLAAAPALQSEEMKEVRKSSASQSVVSSPSIGGGGGGGEAVLTYFFCGEEIPYRRSMKSHCLTLGHFKEQLRKKGNYRYYFKKASDEFECGAVFEEVSDDGTLLPTYEGKILGKVERME